VSAVLLISSQRKRRTDRDFLCVSGRRVYTHTAWLCAFSRLEQANRRRRTLSRSLPKSRACGRRLQVNRSLSKSVCSPSRYLSFVSYTTPKNKTEIRRPQSPQIPSAGQPACITRAGGSIRLPRDRTRSPGGDHGEDAP